VTASRRPALVAVVLATAMFALALGLRARIDPFVSTAFAASVTIPLSMWALGRARLTRLFDTTRQEVVVAIVIGVGLVLATHAVYAVMPFAVRHEVRVLYRSIEGDLPRVALAAITGAVVIAEELVWRGAALELRIPRVTSRVAAAGLAVLLYVVPQLAGGAWLLVLAALGLGTLFTWQRVASGSLVRPLVTHAIWSISIFVLVPLR
jgi:membrane protease YdiL (CAAX protease family)